jgi:hypothetical protein
MEIKKEMKNKMNEEMKSVVIIDFLNEVVYFRKIPSSEIWDAETKTPPSISIRKIETVKDLLKALQTFDSIKNFKVKI